MQNVKKRLGFHNEIASRMCDASTKVKTNGTRLRRLLLDGGSQVLRKLFDGIHSSSALPSVLKTNEEDLKKKCKFPSQIELLFPIDGQPDSKKFDITLLTLLLRNICSLTAPPTGWGKEPSPSDQSKEANIVRIKLFRNKIQHLPGSGISDEQFEELWNELSSPLMALGLPEDEIEKLKVTPIDDSSEIQERFKTLCDHEHRIENLEEKINEYGAQISTNHAQIEEIKEELQNRKKQETVKSCIPDEPSIFIARKEELKEIIDAKTIDDIPYVLIHGMAGIGKSTLIKKASWHLVYEHNKTVYFVDLCRCKATEEEISKTINYTLYRGTKVENEPREALNIWARNLDRKVILVLDNAEHVLSSSEPRTGNDANCESGMSCLVKILLELRKFSSLNVNYLIASREILNFDAIDVPRKDITLKPFEQNESLEFINRVLSEETRGRSELTNDRKQEIVKLCSNIPLALRIVIPLLDDYKTDELIKKLSKPVENIKKLKEAVSLSFEKLDDTLRGHLVRLTIFPRFFAVDSALAVMGVDDLDDAVQVLMKLYAKSLLQREKRKYSLHPFIHEFVVDYGNAEKNKYLLEEGKLNFLSYFQSLLLENTKLYWTKDSCKQSLSAFREDRQNFEKALELSLCVPVDLNETRMENTKRILDELTNVILYLVACTSWDLLGRLLDNFITLAKKNDLPSRELESLCWKGHMARRKGDNEEYEKLLKQADKVYQSGLQIDDRAKICYNSAKGRYFVYKRNYEQGVKAFEEIIEFCMEKEDNDSRLNEDYTRANLELGHSLKGKKDFKKAVEKYKQANAIYEKHLGLHIKTAISFKDIADGYLTQGDAQLRDGDNEQQALDYYKKANDIYNKAIDMLTDLNSDSETHMILLLKNKGICCRKLEKYEDSETHFMKAITIAENNLKENHRYKCLVKEGLAHLHDEMGNKEKARTFAEEANEMAKNLKSGDCIKDRERLETILSYNSTS